ncbi:uridine 5'-monophosphate synthase [Ischnura elegans]|uniref:uridine 5'-monophosphate synthase n=1 Tax=Ischnura elegans TaxID=197161 RepID=UPI001ED87E55|nr:uridine 5'-monophosphate synthase [Ischnura elegans]
MNSIEQKINSLVVDLYKVGALKFGDFKMKVGINSPVYVDLRVLVSHPKVLENLSLLAWECAEPHVKGDHICGVPYNALSMATIISVRHNIPMLIRRKEAKKYGTKKLVEGQFKVGDTCVIIEDIVTSGSSIMETVKDLESEGLKVAGAVIIVDRGQGGMKNLAENGINAHSMLTLTKMMQILCDEGFIDKTVVSAMDKYLKESQISIPLTLDFHHCQVNRLKMSYGERANVATSPVGRSLLQLMETKKTNLCVAVDVGSAENLLSIASQIGPYICLLKTHADAVGDFCEETAKSLEKISIQENFMIMEDRKFSDIGHTVALQYNHGPLRIAKWAHFITCHAIAGPGSVSALKSAADDQPRGCFLVAEMSSEGNLITSTYTKETVSIAETHSTFVAGLVSQSDVTTTLPGLIQLTPGVRLSSGTSDGMGQQWVTPEEAVLKRGADVVVVGRGITESQNIKEAAKLYQSKLWAAYQTRVRSG